MASRSPSKHPDSDLDATVLENLDERNPNGNVNTASIPRRRSQGSEGKVGTWHSVEKQWRRNVCVTVPHECCQDHFALERTYLGYLRTGLALSFTAVFIAQLFRIQHGDKQDPTFGFYVLGKPLACICVGAAIIVTVVGSVRFWRQQNAMLRGKVLAGGWELNVIGLTISIVTLTVFVLVVAVDSRKAMKGEA